MKLKSVGLVVLVAAHVSAQALPNVCLKNYRMAKESADQTAVDLEHQKLGVWTVGLGGGLAGIVACEIKTRSIGCPLIFGAVMGVSYFYGKELEDQQIRLLNSSYIYQLYLEGKSEGDQAGVVRKTIVRMMENGELCDLRGHPNKTVADLLATIEQLEAKN